MSFGIEGNSMKFSHMVLQILETFFLSLKILSRVIRLHPIPRLRMCYKNMLIFQWFLCFMWSDNVFECCLFACFSNYFLIFLLQIPTLECILSPFALPKSSVVMIWNFHGNSIQWSFLGRSTVPIWSWASRVSLTDSGSINTPGVSDAVDRYRIHHCNCPYYLRFCNVISIAYPLYSIWKETENVLNKQLRTADKGWSSSLGVGLGLTNSHRKK
jgi:hypothetical protein